MPLPVVLYIASIIGAVALLLMMPKHRLNWKPVGALLGAATLGGVWLLMGSRFGAPDLGVPIPAPPWGWGDEQIGIEPAAFGFHYIFGAIAIAAAVAVITNKRPVYAALWFVMVVLASAGMFLTLQAEFIAFAMVIIYGGAILVTYMFVIMLASEQQQSTDIAAAPEYERVAREPMAAVGAGFLLLAVLLNVMFEPMTPNPLAAAESDAVLAATVLTERTLEVTEDGTVLSPTQATIRDAGGSAADAVELSNTERIGLDLFRGHPLGLELAGVILLVALIGAVVIARTRIPAEDEDDGGPTPGQGGATVQPDREPGPHSPEVLEAAGSGKMGH